MPVSPLITRRGAGDEVAQRAEVGAARQDAVGRQPGAAGDRRGEVALGRRAGDEDRAVRCRRGRRRRRRTGRRASAWRRRRRRGGRGPARRRPGGGGRASGRRRSSGSAGIPTSSSSAHHRARSCGCAAATASHSGPSQPGPASAQRNPMRRRGLSASSARWLCGPVPCRLTATSGAGPDHGTAVGSGVGSSRSTPPMRSTIGASAARRRQHEPVLRVRRGAARAARGRRRAGRRSAARAAPEGWAARDRARGVPTRVPARTGRGVDRTACRGRARVRVRAAPPPARGGRDMTASLTFVGTATTVLRLGGVHPAHRPELRPQGAAGAPGLRPDVETPHRSRADPGPAAAATTRWCCRTCTATTSTGSPAASCRGSRRS